MWASRYTLAGVISRIPYSVSRILPLKEFVIALKFAGRKQPRFFPRLLKRSSVLGNTPSFVAPRIALGLAVFCGLGWLLTALMSAIQGGAAGFALTLVVGYAVAGFGWWAAAGVLGLGAIWIYPAQHFNRKPFDALLLALLVFELFVLIRWPGILRSPAAIPDWDAAALLEKSSAIFALLLLLSLLAAWMLRPKHGKTYQMSAPTRVTGFLKKRRRRMLMIGGALMIVAVSGVVIATQLAFDGNIPGFYGGGEYEIVLAPIAVLPIFVVCDAIYLLGRHYWYRLT